jgi:outer membrane protein
MNGRVAILGLLLAWPALAGAAEPLTLEQAIKEGLSRNPDARLARHRISSARAGLEQANAAVWPRLQFQSSYTRTDNPMLVFGSILNQRAFSDSLNFNDVPDIDDVNVKGMLTMPLYAGGSIRAGQRAAKANTEAAKHESDAVRNALAFEIARAFHSVRKTREFIRAAEASVRSYQGSVEIAQKRLDAGTLLKSDLLDLQVRLAQAREDLVRATNAKALAERALGNLVGIESGGVEVVDDAPTVGVPKSMDQSGRPELAAAQSRERAAEQQAKAAKGGYSPKLSAFGSLDYDYGTKYNSDGESYTAGAMLQWDAWNGNLTRGKVHEAQANVEIAREESRKTRLALSLELEQAQLELKAANERLQVSQEAVAQAAESEQLTRARFEQGTALHTQLMDAQTALTAARVRRAEAESDQRIAIAGLRKALGMSQVD